MRTLVARMRRSKTRWLAIGAMALALPAAAQSVPALNVTDMWWNPAESGWAISMMQSSTSNQVYALWHTYDPREPASNPGDFKPIWIVMTGGTWTTPTTFVGDAYVTNGSPFFQPWTPGAFVGTRVGRYTLNFTTASRGTMSYELTAPPNLAATDPAFGFPTLNGAKAIERYKF